MDSGVPKDSQEGKKSAESKIELATTHECDSYQSVPVTLWDGANTQTEKSLKKQSLHAGITMAIICKPHNPLTQIPCTSSWVGPINSH